MGQIRDFFRSDFITFGSSLTTEIWSKKKKSHTCLILSQSGSFWGHIWPLRWIHSVSGGHIESDISNINNFVNIDIISKQVRNYRYFNIFIWSQKKTHTHKTLVWLQSRSDWLQMRQIRDFFRSDFSAFGAGRQMHWNLIWKSPGFVPFWPIWANL